MCFPLIVAKRTRVMTETNSRQSRQPFPIQWNRRTLLDVLFVLVLPVACLALDPGILRAGRFGEGFLSEIQLPAYVLIAFLIGAFWLYSLSLPLPFAAAVLKGALIMGAVLSGLFAIVLTPLAVWFLPGAVLSADLAFVALFLFGLVPPFTAHRYIRRLRAMPKRNPAQRSFVGLVIAGVIAPPVLAAVVHIGVGVLLKPSFRDLRSGELDVALSAATKLAESPFCLSACHSRIIRLYCSHETSLEPSQFLPLFGGVHGNIRVTEYGCDSA